VVDCAKISLKVAVQREILTDQQNLIITCKVKQLNLPCSA